MSSLTLQSYFIQAKIMHLSYLTALFTPSVGKNNIFLMPIQFYLMHIIHFEKKLR